jgi:hypothetical protein
MREKNGMSKCVGFARIDDDAICEQIVRELNGRQFPGKLELFFIQNVHHFQNTIKLEFICTDYTGAKNRTILVKLADSWGIMKPVYGSEGGVYGQQQLPHNTNGPNQQTAHHKPYNKMSTGNLKNMHNNNNSNTNNSSQSNPNISLNDSNNNNYAVDNLNYSYSQHHPHHPAAYHPAHHHHHLPHHAHHHHPQQYIDPYYSVGF